MSWVYTAGDPPEADGAGKKQYIIAAWDAMHGYDAAITPGTGVGEAPKNAVSHP